MSEALQFAEHIVKTDLCAIGDIYARLPMEYAFHQNTTLNFAHQVFHEKVPSTRPVIQYFGIGIRGFKNADDGILANPHIPRNREHGLYEQIPFRVVPVSEDLTEAERTQYRLRVRKTINNEPYYCYYLKKITMLDTQVQILRINPETQEQEPYIFSASDLTPTPPVPSTSGEQSGHNSKIVVGTKILLPVRGYEVMEAINVLYNGDMRYAKISEWGLYSGNDEIVQMYDADNIAFNAKEAIYAQLNYKICNTGMAVTSAQSVLDRKYFLGEGTLIKAENI